MDLADNACHVWLFSVQAAVELCESGGCRGAETIGHHRFCPCVRTVVLSWYVGKAPALLSIRREVSSDRDSGRPFLADHILDFSISHCSELFAIAIVSHGRVGVDAELEVLPSVRADIAGLVLTSREASSLALVGETSTERRFTSFWCRKEAVSKYSGHGLAFPFTVLDVLDDDVQSVSPIDSFAVKARVRSWTAGNGAECAVAFGMDVDELQIFDLSTADRLSGKSLIPEVQESLPPRTNQG
ncbi:MAG: hypothetical protein B5766_00690 [Candidatus Lumbricidophila eiseniae]|uniref:4'-phosphopantetheinyl transferase domain-containing protein n=1 Tax=Candidatus Lumbricidiphila eiseniae TaxID=1969409 RepID=A0A2A6FUU4_9MICO|nr:MAG: hypothetical protein B5766_00690 [Candidatus Lumbricidophila eiseniae]